jgi:hypothetical protein
MKDDILERLGAFGRLMNCAICRTTLWSRPHDGILPNSRVAFTARGQLGNG